MRTFVFFAVSLAWATPALAQDFDAAKAFGTRESVEHASLSPDGTRIAYVTPGAGQGSVVYVAPLDRSAPPKRIAATDGQPDRIGYCRWASNTRLLCNIYGVIADPVLVTASRMVGIDADGSNVTVLHHTRGNRDLLGSANFGGASTGIPVQTARC